MGPATPSKAGVSFTQLVRCYLRKMRTLLSHFLTGANFGLPRPPMSGSKWAWALRRRALGHISTPARTGRRRTAFLLVSWNALSEDVALLLSSRGKRIRGMNRLLTAVVFLSAATSAAWAQNESPVLDEAHFLQAGDEFVTQGDLDAAAQLFSSAIVYWPA